MARKEGQDTEEPNVRPSSKFGQEPSHLVSSCSVSVFHTAINLSCHGPTVFTWSI